MSSGPLANALCCRGDTCGVSDCCYVTCATAAYVIDADCPDGMSVKDNLGEVVCADGICEDSDCCASPPPPPPPPPPPAEETRKNPCTGNCLSFIVLIGIPALIVRSLFLVSCPGPRSCTLMGGRCCAQTSCVVACICCGCCPKGGGADCNRDMFTRQGARARERCAPRTLHVAQSQPRPVEIFHRDLRLAWRLGTGM